MDFSELSKFTGIDALEINGIWEDFKNEFRNCVSNNSKFVYPRVLYVDPETHFVDSQFIRDVINGKDELDKCMEDIVDERERKFALIIAYIYKKASEGGVKIEGLGEFKVKGEMPDEKTMLNPVTGAPMKFPKSSFLKLVLRPSPDIDNPPPRELLKEYRIILEEVPEGEESTGSDDDNVGFRSKLGGEPNWIQEPEVPVCPDCGIPMTFVGQIDSIEQMKYTHNNSLTFTLPTSKILYDFGDAGMLYLFYCFYCSHTESVFQCY